MGSDKVLLDTGESTFLDALIHKAAPFFAEVVLLSAGRRYAPGLLHLSDPVKGVGPLGGLMAALQHTSHDDIAVAAVDLPFLSEETLRKLSVLDLTETEGFESLDDLAYVGLRRKPALNPEAHIPGLIRRHEGGEHPKYQTLILRDGDILQPLAGIYHRSCLPQLEEYVADGRRSVNGFLSRLHVGVVSAAPGELANVNTPEEYRQALEMIRNRL